MALKRPNRKKRRPTKRRAFKKALRPLKHAVGLTSQGRPPKDLQKFEVKIYDSGIVSTTVNSTGFIGCVNGMSQNVYNTTRVGNRIHMKYVDLKYSITSQQVVNNVNAMFRCLLIYDKESNGTMAPITNGGVYNAGGTNGILDTAITTGNSTVNCMEQYYFINKERYVVLYDEAFPLIPKEAGVALLINQTIFKNVRIPLNTYVMYSTGQSGFDSITEGSLLVCFMTDQLAGGGTNIGSIKLNTRVFFTDS